jgi:hypothetical protein
MIDYNRFWHEPGCAPGLTKEETATQFRQMAQWLSGLPGAIVQGEPDLAQQPGLFPGPGVTDGQIQAWERECGVRLPDVLRQALSRQDGGYLRNMQFRILPLAEIAPPDDEFWEFTGYKDDEVPDRGLVFQFAWNEELSGSYYLNYARGAQEDPSVFVHHHDPGDLDKCSGSVTKFFSRMLATSESPSVDWSETDGLVFIARETVELSAIHNGAAQYEQLLGRLEGRLVLYTHDRSPKDERLTKTMVPEPLDGQAAQIQRHRPDPISTYGLTLQPEDSEGIVEHESQRTPDGTWKNSVSNGVPICVTFESTDRNRLVELRKTLFGANSAAKAELRDRNMENLQQQMQSLSPEQQQAAGIAMILDMQRRQQSEHPLDPESMPPEAATLHAMLQEKLRDAERRAQEIVARLPLNPEIQRLLRKVTEPDEGTERPEV